MLIHLWILKVGYRDRIATGLDDLERLGCEKAITPDLLAADDAFEQASTTAVVDFVKRAHWRQHIAQHAAINGHVIGRASKFGERRKVWIMWH